MFLLMYALFLVMNHPMKNFNANIMVMSESATCGQEMALNKTKELAAAAAAPMQSMFCLQNWILFQLPVGGCGSGGTLCVGYAK